jgi:DNA helicase-2/ATP-dependent DNA helicase PcrA
VEQIETHAREHGLTLWRAIEQIIDGQQLSTRSQSSLVTFRNVIQEIALVASSEPLPDVIRFILERTGYRKMLQQEKTPESEARQENLDELVSAAVEAAESGKSISEFLDEAALVAEADAFDEGAPVHLMTLHNAKGLEFPVVFLTGMEMGLFPHSRSMDSEAALEEERRLCYVGMTRARKKLILTWARFRRRYGGGEQEKSTPSWFLGEIPANLVVDLGVREEAGEVDLLVERYGVRESVRRNVFTGKTYNSLENISQFFNDRGMAFPPPRPAEQPRAAGPRPQPPAPAKPVPAPPAPARRGARPGATVEHPKYGTGTVVRREGDGEDAKITVNFPRFGLKKLVEKYAGLKKS